MEAKGYKKTCFGYLSEEEIKESGLVFRDNHWFVPAQWKIAQETNGSHRKGEKYLGVTEQFLKWKNKTTEDQAEEYMKKSQRPQITQEDKLEINF